MNILNIILNPQKLYWKIKWEFIKKKLHYCGNNTSFSLSFVIKEPEYISIGSNTHFGNNCDIETQFTYKNCKTGYLPKLVIGSNVNVTSNCFVSCMNELNIGDGCLFGPNVFITDNFHGSNSYNEMDIPPNDRKLYSKGPVNIGKNVWLGRNVCVMPNVTIGDYSIIGANSVVTHNIPAYAIAAGTPARVIKYIK